MGEVRETQQSNQDKEQEAKEVDELKSKLFSTLELETDEPAKEQSKEGTSEEEVEEKTEEEETETESEEKDTSEEEKVEDEEVIPRSKFEKTVSKLENRINQLTAQLKQQQSAPRETSSKDADMERLLKMDEAALKDLKRQVRLAQIKEAAAGKDDARVEALLELESKIDEVVTTAPQRFAQKQVSLYNEAADDIMQDEEIGDVEKAAPQIKEIAQRIYTSYPKLQRIEEGQAMALRMAAEHFKMVNKLSSGKEVDKTKVTELKQKLNTLKRKTALDSSGSKAASARSEVLKLREQAFRGAEDKDRLNLIKNDPAFSIDAMIPEEYKE